MKKINLQAFRLSISWPRIMPDGTNKEINWKGVEFYNRLIDKLIENGIEPYVTLYHWDLPAALSKDISKDGWLSTDTVDCFKDYADFCFGQFGDRVKHWITVNEFHI